MDSEFLKTVKGFDWDQSNTEKNNVKHGVYYKEAEEVFSNNPLYQSDAKHSYNEKRYLAVGKTNTNRRLSVFFTIRNDRIRVISARPSSKKERNQYEKAKAKKNP